MTLTRAVFNLEKTFGYHMIYVAMSRTTLDGLYMRGFDPKKIIVDPIALAFVREMEQRARDISQEFDPIIDDLTRRFETFGLQAQSSKTPGNGSPDFSTSLFDAFD